MSITVEIPENLVEAFARNGADMSRAVLEAVTVEGYRRKLLGES